jgi:PAS domain S-box-containing protein
MDVIIYSFFIVSGIAGLSYYTIRRRFARLLEEEQEKSFALRNSELQLASEKQRLESALNEKEQQIDQIRSHIHTEESKAGSLSSEVLSKDKQIQSLTAQLQHETNERTTLEQELRAVEQHLSELHLKISAEETRASLLNTTVVSKEQQISSLSAELQQQITERSRLEQLLADKERVAASLSAQVSTEEEQRAALSAALTQKEEQFQSASARQTMEHQQINEMLQREIAERQSAEDRSRETIRELQHQLEQLQNELSSTRGANESLNSAREQLSSEFRQNEEQLRQQLAETTLVLSVTKQELEKTTELLQEQSSIRQATEHALQESKHKLYALIADLEQKIKDQSNAIAALQTQLTQTSSDLDLAVQSIHHLFRNVPIPVFVVNEMGVCEYCNSALEDLVGFGMTELSDKHFSRLFPDDERAFYEEQWMNTDNRAEQFQGETRIVAATGDAISATVSFVDIHPNSESVKYAGFIIDRTTEKDSQKHFTAAKEREQELLDLKSRFIGMVSNQLRTSLVTVATNTELLERFMDKWSDERRYHSFLRINESIRQMIELVRDVTFTTRATTDRYTISISTFDLEALFQSAAKELMTDLESHHHFILSERGDISSVALDENLVKTIANQLLSNAFKYSRDNTEVRVHIEHSDSTCIIRITDQGIGIPAAEQKHLFSSFFRASNVTNIYGTGLGLTIVQQCVQMHGGNVVIESELNKGTTVTVTLPIHQIN